MAAESGDLLYWDMETRKVVHQEKQENIQQIFYYKNQSRCVVVSKKGSKGNESGLCVSRSVPEETGIRFKLLCPGLCLREPNSGSSSFLSLHSSRWDQNREAS